MTGHYDADALAEHRDGLLGRRRSARISAHVAGCARCSALAADLAEVSALLASVPPPPMPDELITRLDGVLAAESAARAQAQAAMQSAGGPEDVRSRLERTTGPTGRGAGRPPSGPAGPGRTRRTSALRAASVAAAVLALAGGGYGVARLVQGGSVPSTSGASGAGGSHAPAILGPRRPNSAIGGGSAITTPGASLPVVYSGTDYLPGRLAVQAQAVLARYSSGQTVFAPVTGNTADPRGCASLVAGGARLRLVDVARYRGKPAIVIMTAAAAGRPGQIWVAGEGCPAAGRDLIAHAQLTGAG